MNKNNKILLIGDSITQYSIQIKDNLGWGCHLNEFYMNKADILIRAKKSHTTTSMLPHISEIFNENNNEQYISNLDMVVLTLGSNDASNPSVKKWMQYTSLEDYENNINKILDIMSNKVKYILLVTPPQMHTENWNKFSAKHYKLEPNIKSNELTKTYADKIKEIKNKRKESNIYLVDLWEQNWGHTAFVDGLHLSKEGNKLFFNALKKTINLIPEMDPKNIQDNIPDFKF